LPQDRTNNRGSRKAVRILNRQTLETKLP